MTLAADRDFSRSLLRRPVQLAPGPPVLDRRERSPLTRHEPARSDASSAGARPAPVELSSVTASAPLGVFIYALGAHEAVRPDFGSCTDGTTIVERSDTVVWSDSQAPPISGIT